MESVYCVYVMYCVKMSEKGRREEKQKQKVYSNGLSEIILGNAIKKLKLPREEIVVMTKVSAHPFLLQLRR